MRVTALMCAALAVLSVTTGTTAAAAADPTRSPVLHVLDDTPVRTNPTFAWDSLEGATGYRVQIDDQSTFASPLYDKATVALHATPDTQLPRGELFWRVAATFGRENGPFGEPDRFELRWGAPPELDEPADGDELSFPTESAVFRWKPVAGTKEYLVEVDDASDFVNAQSFRTPNTSLALTTPQSVGQKFYWRVQARSGSTSVVGDWSEVRSYSFQWLATAVPTAPDNDTTVTLPDVRLSWRPVSGASKYRVQISPNGDWANNVALDTTSFTTSYTPATPPANGSYFWRVQAIDAAGHLGAWNDPWSFSRGTTERPTLLEPQWDAADEQSIPRVSANPTFRWTPVAHAAQYQLQVSTNENFSTLIGECTTNHTSWTPYVDASGTKDAGSCTINAGGNVWASGVTHYWRVRGVDPAGNTVDSNGNLRSGTIVGLWSETPAGPSRFIPAPDVPTRLRPENGSTVEVPTLRWDAVAGADQYRVAVRRPNGTVVASTVTYATSWTPPTALRPADGPFTWAVSSINGYKQTSASAQATFALTDVVGGAQLNLTEPADDFASLRMPAMAWTAVAGAAKYEVHYARNGFEQTPLLASAQAYPTFAYTGAPLAAGDYQWWVVALAASGNPMQTSEARSFRITKPGLLGSSDYTGPVRCSSSATTCVSEPDTPRFSWTPSPEASMYQLYVATDPNFTSVLRRYTTPASSLTPRDSLLDSQAGQAYYWFVRACVDSLLRDCGPGPDTSDALSTASAFRKRSAPVALDKPARDGVADTPTTFTWNDYLDSQRDVDPRNEDAAQQPTQEAKQYRFQVSTVADFTSILDTQVVNATSYTPAALTYPEGPLYWRVQAIDASNNNLTWSETRLTTKRSAGPVALSPDAPDPTTKSVQSEVPVLRWHPLDYASQYAVEVYRNGDGNFSPSNKVAAASGTTKFAAFAPTVGLPRGDYAWRVRGIDGGNNPGSWSAAATFAVLPSPPDGLSPEDGYRASSTDMLFTWGAVDTAAQYRWLLSTTPAFSSPTSQLTVMTSWSPLTAIADGTYYWRVEALDGSSNVIATSDSSSFVRDGTAPRVTSRTPSSGVPLTGSIPVTFSEPVTGADASSLRLTIAGTSTPVPVTVTPGPAAGASTSATVTPAVPLVPGQSYTLSAQPTITDRFGNPVAPYATTFRADTDVDSASVAVSENWARKTVTAASGGSYDAANLAGSRAEFRFTGTNVTVLGTRASNGGYARIVVDGVVRASAASFYAASPTYRAAVFAVSGLADGPHTVQVIALGTRPRGATDSWVLLDAFRVGSLTTEQNSGAVREYLRRVTTSAASGGSFDIANQATSVATGRPGFGVRFAGTGVTVYGVRAPSFGYAYVIVDGVVRAKVSLRGSTVYGLQVYSSPMLTNSVHTIRLEAIGTPTGAGSLIGLDRVVVR